MIVILYEIPGRSDIKIKNIVFDYNGTIASDGKLIEGVKESLNSLATEADIYILTADTYGSVERECKDIEAKILTFPKEDAGRSKKKIVEKLGGKNTISIGNGFNDIAMFEQSVLSIGVIGKEGLAGKLLTKADIVVCHIMDAINIILNNNMVKATLRS